MTAVCDSCRHVIRNLYSHNMTAVQQALDAEHIDFSRDGRFDTPGHSALYSTYTLMDVKSSLIVASQLVKVTETTSSQAMEKEGLIRCRREVEDAGVCIGSLTTDQHIMIAPYMRKEWTELTHYFDLWHIAKNLKKKLCEFASVAANRVVGHWSETIIRHLYHVVVNTEPGNSLTAVKLRPILERKGLIDAVSKAGRLATTELESFHAEINRNAPKMEGFSNSGMLSWFVLKL
ncbi:uncharacterized protein [Watersipora subatra]|uniref:uncharacterized protein n=1 Tax=Watersipora subatra TaxID=2589382 RepID=UPI00355C125E